ncbi:MAG: 6-pyruvoyl tetrahydropterin synthase family protein [Planctomycetes bacterium]|nr:6-pyruvoyl tetrahydropterin synthase family protein [Planctomycetota bacterium]
MKQKYHVRIEKERLVFSAAHFITFDGDVCERLHGHNYHVAAEVHGPLDENHYVVDFIALRDELQSLVDDLDHRMLLPTEHATIRVVEQAGEVSVTHGERRWVFPRGDCALLPVANTTAELLARYLGEQLLAALERRLGKRPERLRISVEECDGQWATCELCAE